MEAVAEATYGRKVTGLKKKVAAAERAVATLKLKTIARLVFDRYHGGEANRCWFRSVFISKQDRNWFHNKSI